MFRFQDWISPAGYNKRLRKHFRTSRCTDTSDNFHTHNQNAVDAAISAENISSIEYIRIAYKQGIIDAFSALLLPEL